VGKAYGVFNEERGMDKRAAFVVDGTGVVRWMKVYEPGTVPDSKELLAELAKV
jgi:alkyl hydroperoxide reductase subunit AhpC